MQEVPDLNILQDPDMDEEPTDSNNNDDDINDFLVAGDDDDNSNNNNNDGDHPDEDYDTDGDYVDNVGGEDAAAVLFGNRDNARRGGGRGRRGRRGAAAAADEEEEEGEGEDLIDNALKDYQPIAALDTYGRDGIDDRDYDGLDVDERAAADRILDERDKERRKMSRVGGRDGALYSALNEQLDGEWKRMLKIGRNVVEILPRMWMMRPGRSKMMTMKKREGWGDHMMIIVIP